MPPFIFKQQLAHSKADVLAGRSGEPGKTGREDIMGYLFVYLVGFALVILFQAALLRAAVRFVAANAKSATFTRALVVSFGLCLVGLAYGLALSLVVAMTGTLSTAGLVLAGGGAVALRMVVVSKAFHLAVSDVVMLEVVLWAGGALVMASLFLLHRAPFVLLGAAALGVSVWVSRALAKRRDAQFFDEVSAALDRKASRA
jgi:hypothetical protein